MCHIRHVDLVVSSLDRSLPFYKGVLGVLSWSMMMEVPGEHGETIHYLASPSGFASGAIGLRQAPHRAAPRPYYRYSLGLHHTAFNARSKDEVDSVANWLEEHDATIESGPAHYYSDGYYAVFFYDPDGIKLEVVARLETS